MHYVYDVAHSLPLGGAGRDFPFTEDETRRHFSYFSGTFREHNLSSCQNVYHIPHIIMSCNMIKYGLTIVISVDGVFAMSNI